MSNRARLDAPPSAPGPDPAPGRRGCSFSAGRRSLFFFCGTLLLLCECFPPGFPPGFQGRLEQRAG